MKNSKTCPFCGSLNVKVQRKDSQPDSGMFLSDVVCIDCGATLPVKVLLDFAGTIPSEEILEEKIKSKALKQWNTRIEDFKPKHKFVAYFADMYDILHQFNTIYNDILDADSDDMIELIKEITTVFRRSKELTKEISDSMSYDD